jgi:hypothetical protein
VPAGSRPQAGSGKAATVPDFRTWTSKDGLFTLQARFVKVDDDGKIRLRRSDGSEISVATEQFGESDQVYLRQLITGRP